MPDLKEIKTGQRVRFHPIIGGKHDGKIYTVRQLGRLGDGRYVAWLNEKSGCVAIDALSQPEEGPR